MHDHLHIRPYARLITMLGDQLIKDESTALMELIKNAYDADASWVKVTLRGFNKDLSARPGSSIIIEDDGTGMNRTILERDWLNPATPVKRQAQEAGTRTQRGRVLQGEKGIGRFAVFKLGRTVRLTTRRQGRDAAGRFVDAGEDRETTLTYDFAPYGDDFLQGPDHGRALFLDDLQVDEEQGVPGIFTGGPMVRGRDRQAVMGTHGTRITISSLRGAWGARRVESVRRSMADLQSPHGGPAGFRIYYYADDRWMNTDGDDDPHRALDDLIRQKAVVRVQDGRFHQDARTFTFTLDGRAAALPLDDPAIQGLDLYAQVSDVVGAGVCGDFTFDYAILDAVGSAGQPTRYRLDAQDRTLVRGHGVTLYRDGIRVMPYGTVGDDWLDLHGIRAGSRAAVADGALVVGQVGITRHGNPDLRDTTNREGLVDTEAFNVFRSLLRLLLAWLHAGPYGRYLARNAAQEASDGAQQATVHDLLRQAGGHAGRDRALQDILNRARQRHDRDLQAVRRQARRTEDLAAVGLSVETASHDMMMLMNRSVDRMHGILHGDDDPAAVRRALQDVSSQLDAIRTQMQDIQSLFPSAKGHPETITVADAIRQVESIYRRALDRYTISVTLDEGPVPLQAEATRGVLLQVFVNLFDNALWWLQHVDGERRIAIRVDGDRQQVVFADNGPGVDPANAPYIFDAFFSGRGTSGRGLGLYITRQLLDRFGYTIALMDDRARQPLPGAAFLIDFHHGS